MLKKTVLPPKININIKLFKEVVVLKEVNIRTRAIKLLKFLNKLY